MSEPKEKAPVSETDADAASKPTTKKDSWFPVARADVAKIRNNYSAADAARLISIMVELLSCANYWGKSFQINLDRLAARTGFCRQTVSKRLEDLQRIKLIKMKGKKRGIGGRWDITGITVKTSLPCSIPSKINAVDRVKKVSEGNLTVNNTPSSLREEEGIVIEKEETTSVSTKRPTPNGAASGTGGSSDDWKKIAEEFIRL